MKKWNITYHGQSVSQEVAGERWAKGETRTITNESLAIYLDGRAGFEVRAVESEAPKKPSRRKPAASTAPAPEKAPSAKKGPRSGATKTKAKAKAPAEAGASDSDSASA